MLLAEPIGANRWVVQLFAFIHDLCREKSRFSAGGGWYSPDMGDASICPSCGAPRQAGLVACSFCGTAYAGASSGGVGPSGVDCPRCHADNAADRRSCASCGTSLFRRCLFCETESSVGHLTCPSCHEAFEGAEARQQERVAEERRAQLTQAAVTGASAIGGALLGGTAVSGGGLLGSLMGSLSSAVGLPGSLSSVTGSARRGLVQGMTRAIPGQERGVGAQTTSRPLASGFSGGAGGAATQSPVLKSKSMVKGGFDKGGGFHKGGSGYGGKGGGGLGKGGGRKGGFSKGGGGFSKGGGGKGGFRK